MKVFRTVRFGIIAAVGFALCAATARPANASEVFIAGTVLPTSGSAFTAAYRFDRDGTLLGTFGGQNSASYFSIASGFGTHYVGSTPEGVKRYSEDFTLLGSQAGIGAPITVETASDGFVYATIGQSSGRRLNADASLSHTFSLAAYFVSGIDADRHGNVYLQAYKRNALELTLFKFDAAGSYVAAMPITQLSAPTASDLTIDESGEILFLADGGNTPFGIKAYDISGQIPEYLSAIPTPAPITGGISFDPSTGHLFGADLSGGRGWEFTTEGTVVQQYNMNQTGFAVLAFDIVALPVPEPLAIELATMVLFCLTGPLRGRWQSHLGSMHVLTFPT